MDKSLLEIMPPMLNGEALDNALRILPVYEENTCQKPVTERLMALQDLYCIYIPDAMSREIYTKLYLALLRSLHKKQTITATRQLTENARLIRQQTYESIIGGADVFTIIAPSGRGKTSAISRSTTIIMETPIIDFNGGKLISCLNVQCPADTSIKGLLFEILRKTDEILDSKYYSNAIRAKSTVDTLIGTVSQVALNHIGLLIIDEIQNVVNKNGKAIIGTLTQLINNSGLSIVMVGTPECELFFSSEQVLARRSTGLSYSNFVYGEEYKAFISTLFKYNYTNNIIDAFDSLCMWLYSHSGGNIAITVQLVHDAQEIAILSGTERLDTASLNQAFEKRLRFLHEFIKPEIIYAKSKRTEMHFEVVNATEEPSVKILDISLFAKRMGNDVVSVLKEQGFVITEVVL